MNPLEGSSCPRSGLTKEVEGGTDENLVKEREEAKRKVAGALNASFDAGTAVFYPGTTRELGFVLLQQWLTENDIHAILKASRSELSFDPGDRGKKLKFRHKVLRIEDSLLHSEVWYKLLSTLNALDKEVWGVLQGGVDSIASLPQEASPEKSPSVFSVSSENGIDACAVPSESLCVFPEAEFITYNVKEEQQECDIAPHTDNESLLTMIAMLTEQDDRTGGDNYFLTDPEENRASGLGYQACCLQRKDLVVFRGEKLTHWISPVTEGNRVILQMEISRMQRGNSGSQIVLNRNSLDFVRFQPPHSTSESNHVAREGS